MPCKGIVLKKKWDRERAGAGDIRDVIVKAIPVTCRCRFQYETLAQWPFFLCVPRPTRVQIATTASLICRRSSVGTSRGHGPTFTLHRWRSCRWKPISQTTETPEDSIKLRTINSFRKYLQSQVKLFKKKWTINQLLLSTPEWRMDIPAVGFHTDGRAASPAPPIFIYRSIVHHRDISLLLGRYPAVS